MQLVIVVEQVLVLFRAGRLSLRSGLRTFSVSESDHVVDEKDILQTIH